MNDAIDCHAHVIDPARFPFVPGKGYQPRADEAGPREAYWSTLTSHGVSHGLLVQPSGYAYDNRAMLDAMAFASGRGKGIAVVEDDASDDTLDALTAAGCIGVRLNLGSFDPDFFERATAARFLRRMHDRKLFVQVYASARRWTHIAPVLADSGVSLIVDHMGEPDLDEGLGQPGFAAVLALGRSGRAIVKLSAAYRISRQPAPHRDVATYAQACIEAFGVDRCVWGSDWPFLNAGKPTSYADQLAWLECAVPDPPMRRRILAENPRKLFGFAGARP
jgi:predicted TIM-barrel fold metal-dependent hydrolase